MLKKILAAIVFAWVGYSAYEYYTGPFYGASSTKEGEFLVAFKGGFRGVMSGVGDRDQT